VDRWSFWIDYFQTIPRLLIGLCLTLTAGIGKEVIKTCIHCADEFDATSRQKRTAGGKINECPECVESLGTETAVSYLGVCMGEGKQGGVQILAFEDDSSRSAYLKAWRNNSGQNKGKSCQLGGHLSSTGGIRFKKKGETPANSNHKGRAD
jgi:hypothetical protein